MNDESESKKLLLYIKGRIDSNTAPEFQSLIGDKLDEIENLILDFSEVDYISSAGLRVLLSAYKEMKKKGGSVAIEGANKAVEEVLYITGFEDFLDVKGARRKGNDTKTDEDSGNTAGSDAEQSGREEDNDSLSEVQRG